jgi:hypothetical protein
MRAKNLHIPKNVLVSNSIRIGRLLEFESLLNHLLSPPNHPPQVRAFTIYLIGIQYEMYVGGLCTSFFGSKSMNYVLNEDLLES